VLPYFRGGDIRLNFLKTKMASSSTTEATEAEEIPLTREEAATAWANTRVFKVQSKNRPYPLYVLHNQEGKIDRKSVPVCIYNDTWHRVGCDKNTGEPVLKEPRPEIHLYDESSEGGSTDSESDQSIDQDIRNQPVSPAAISP
jgi:hypothetical protein